MKLFGLAGWSGSGKTTLMKALLPELIRRKLAVSTVKHAHHSFDVDQPGKDSYEHRRAGATEVLVASAQRWALMRELRDAPEPTLDALIARLAPVDLLLAEAWQVLLHDLHLSKKAPPRKKFNGAQQIAYTSIILMGAGSILTGLAIYKPVQLGWLTSLLGGYPVARYEHFLLTVGYVLFFAIHIAQVIRAGWNNLRAMITGYEVVTEQDVVVQEAAAE